MSVQPGSNRVRILLQVILARLRFVFILLAIVVVLISWQWLRDLTDWAITRSGMAGAIDPTVSPDTEYFCPMCPGVASTWPEKCPVCKMPLVRRLRGEMGVLPEGVVARMQLSPYRLQLAGIRTAPVQYQPLLRKWRALGRVELDGTKRKTRCEIDLDHLRDVVVGQHVTVRRLDDPTSGSFDGIVTSIQSRSAVSGSSAHVDVELSADADSLAPESAVEIHWQIPLAGSEPYRSMPRNPPPLNESDARQVFVCEQHPTYLHAAAGRCPFHDADLQPQDLAENERLEWICPAHPGTRTATVSDCAECQGLPRTPQITRFSPPGHVLAIPESAVIDSGDHRWVFVERGHGMFDAVEVAVGDRCGDVYPVLGGVHVGQRVVAAGAFLLDAETRLNPGLAAAYFGASQVSSASLSTVTRAAEESDALQEYAAEIPVSDLARIRRQRVCPVTKFPLGSMGSPPRYRVGAHIVYLCCDGCRGSLEGAQELPPSRPNSVNVVAPSSSESPQKTPGKGAKVEGGL